MDGMGDVFKSKSELIYRLKRTHRSICLPDRNRSSQKADQICQKDKIGGQNSRQQMDPVFPLHIQASGQIGRLIYLYEGECRNRRIASNNLRPCFFIKMKLLLQ